MDHFTPQYEVTNSHIYEAYTVSGTQQLFEKFERDQKADQNLLEELAQKLPKESAVVNTQITLTRSLIDLFKIATKQEQYDIVHYLFANLYVDFDKYCLTAFEPKAEFDFLFSTFAPINGWKKEGPRYLLPCHYQLPEEQNQDDICRLLFTGSIIIETEIVNLILMLGVPNFLCVRR